MAEVKAVALIVAAGRGVRAGGDRPKQYQPLAGQPVLAWTLQAFLTHPRITAVRVIINPVDAAHYADLVDALMAGLGAGQREKLLDPVFGGAERQDSVRLGLESFAPDPPDHVLIHDAARPFVGADVINGVLAALARHRAAIAALPVSDTLKRASDTSDPVIAETVPRADIWRAQTPQGFHFADVLAAHRTAAGQALTDDAAVAEAAGIPVALALGSPNNMKLTVAEDFGLAATLIARRAGPAPLPGPVEYRTGHGFDVHGFAEGDHVMLCGVRVPHTQTLSGHSDADAGLHAITDAILGALGEADIGAMFPPSDPQWSGADSAIFLSAARDTAIARGARLTHVDVTLICERPKIGPHRDAMRDRIAGILEIGVDRVSVKATTSEGLGFTGRSEGLAAMATATLAVPSSLTP